MEKVLNSEQKFEITGILKSRFEKNKHRHAEIEWEKVQLKLETLPEKLWSLAQMEQSGGEPDVVGHNAGTNEYLFCDCSPESPAGRRNLCYDREALDSRKEHKPANSVIDVASAMGIELLEEAQYRNLQKLGVFDAKTSSWLKTPSEIRELGGAIFAEYRYGQVFIFHNSAPSYYGSRGFRGLLRV